MKNVYGELVVEQEMIEVRSNSPKPNPNWKFVDKQGHGHFYHNGYPTLAIEESEPYFCGDCIDEHIDEHYVCKHCHEPITPGTMIDPSAHYIAGPITYILKGEVVTEAVAREYLTENILKPTTTNL